MSNHRGSTILPYAPSGSAAEEINVSAEYLDPLHPVLLVVAQFALALPLDASKVGRSFSHETDWSRRAVAVPTAHEQPQKY